MGHETGDRVLVLVAQAVTGELRQSDIFGRVGGEEFVIILPETGEEGAAILAQRLLKAISSAKIDFEGRQFTVTVSAGIAVSESGSIASLEELMKKADNAMYEAKNRGRNRVCLDSQAGAR
jgi:diguanylate cyclase (GGDEF)-like protein